MSFLNSVLSSLSDGKTTLTVPEVRPSKPLKTENNATPSTAKRKAESDIRGLNSNKFARTLPTRPQAETVRAKATPTSKLKTMDASKPAGNANNPAKRLEQNLAVSAAPPKKGSFAEILARGSQNKSATVVGAITHKPKEKLSAKKELQLQKEMALKNKKNGKNNPSINPRSAPGSKADNSASGRLNLDAKVKGQNSKGIGYQGTSKPKSQLAYQGTMKPKLQAANKGTLKPGPQGLKKKDYESEPERPSAKSYTKPRRQQSYSGAESEENQSEDQYDYASEDYSDMDAGFDDMEEEDEKATRLARKEDAAEQRMLEELKRQKEDRKKRAILGQQKEKAMRRG